MAIRNIPVPFCDECGEPWLPKFKLPDGTHNPIFDHPEDSKRCGKCKTTRWNAAGVDKRRKQAEETIPYTAREDKENTVMDRIAIAEEAGIIPQVNLVDTFPKYLPTGRTVPRVTEEDVRQTLDRPMAVSAGRCKHMLYNCPACHPKEAA